MKIGIVGSSGYIAFFLLKHLRQDAAMERVVRIGRSQEDDWFLDLRQAEAFDYAALRELDTVVFSAAISGPDKCAEEFDDCWAVNVTGTGHFIEEALKRGCRVLFFSSDAVFGDIPGAIYREDSKTEANTPYGRMKKAVEDRFCCDAGFKAIRLSYVVSTRDRFLSYCLSCIREKKEADIYHPFYRSCVTVHDVVTVVEWLLHHWGKYDPFVLNVAGRELVSRVRIADELNRLLGDQLHYKISVPDEVFFRNRPKFTQMESLYLQPYCILQEKSFSEKIKFELKEINK